MKPTTFLIVLAATAVSVGAAATAVVTESERSLPEARASGPLFADLLARSNDVATVTIESAAGKLTIARKGAGWSLTEKNGYPVSPDKVRKLVAGLADLRLLEAKTDHADRLARLEVEDVTAKDAKSKQVTLADAAGKPIAALIVGKPNTTFDLNGLRGVYVRKPGDPQSWLAEGAVQVPAAAVDLVDRNVVDVSPDEVRRVHFEPAGVPAMNVSKADKAAPAFALDPLPAGRTADPEAVKRLAQAFAAVTLDDVRADKDMDKAVKAGIVEATTFDGLTLKAELLSLDGGIWLRLHADASGNEAAIAEAKTINERAAGWLFKLPQFKAVLLQPRIDEYLRKQDAQS